MKKILSALGAGLLIASFGVGATASADEPNVNEQTDTQYVQDIEATPNGITLTKGECLLGWQSGYTTDEWEYWTCYMGYYETNAIASAVARGWEAGSSNVRSAQISDMCEVGNLDDWCVGLWVRDPV